MKHKRLTALVLAAALVLAVFIGLGILFDIIGVAVTAADPRPFHSMAAHKKQLRLRCRQPKHRQQPECPGACNPKGTYHGAVHAGKDHPAVRMGQRTEADHPCAAACVRQPGRRLSQR